jgi:ribonuclease HII
MPVKFDRNLIPSSPDLSFERLLWEQGLERVAGLDEAGRGALAGPVVAAVVIFAPGIEANQLAGVRDSKQMLPEQRKKWLPVILTLCHSAGIGSVSAHEIDEIGIVPATCLAMRRAIDRLACLPEHLLLDYLELSECSLPQTILVKGDQRSLSIACASVLAKTWRDAWMEEISQEYPEYGFARHKGYGTLAHRQAIQCMGYSPIHRRSFKWRACEKTVLRNA